MEISSFFPFWEDITQSERQILKRSALHRTAPKNRIIHSNNDSCTGLVLIESGQLRTYLVSEEGREITLYRLLENDICLFSASCMIKGIEAEITVEAEKDTDMYIIPADTYNRLMKESPLIANFTNEIMAKRFSNVMWLMDQVMWKSIDKRLAGFLIDESKIEKTDVLEITHETISSHLGIARETVTRMLKYFQGENLVRLNRGKIEILDKHGLEIIK